MKGKMKKFANIFILLFSVTLFVSCGIVAICYDTPRYVRKSVEYKNMTPIKVSDLKTMLTTDTVHYKIVVIYDMCCGGCIERIETTYPKLLAQTDTNEVRWIFVHSSSGGLNGNEWLLRSNGINNPMYYFRDDTPAFAANIKNTERYVNISRYMSDCDSINSHYGIPLNYLVDKSGRVKLLCQQDETGEYLLAPMQLYEMQGSIQQLDFDKVDTLVVEPKQSLQCTPSGCK